MGKPRSPRAQEGFTLVELLVVLVIVGLLAAIAIPAFFAQREKANDAAAKGTARTAETALETYAIAEDTYEGADPAALHAIEPTLPAGPPLAIVARPATATSFGRVEHRDGVPDRALCRAE